ncbi:hypothetical protein RJ640_012641, partial [Escallonia rubra]
MASHSFQLIDEIDAIEVRTLGENDDYENFDNFDSQQIDGKIFDTLEAAYEFYNQATGAIFRRQFVCNKEGFKKLDDKRPNVNEKRCRDLRTGCKAMMQVTLSKKLGVCVFEKFQDIHNHPLITTPLKVIKHRYHSKYHRTNVCKSLVSDLNDEGLKSSQITRVVNVKKPIEEVGVTPRQRSSIIRIERKNNVGKECYGIIKHFQENATWVDLNHKYELKENWWIQNMYNLGAHWAKPFLKDIFFAGITTSGRSESIHSFFDGYVNSNTMLNEFVVKYDKAVYNRRYAEEDEDFKTMNSRAVLSSDHPIEARVGECYTCSLFEIFKKEWNASVSCSHITLSNEPDVTRKTIHTRYKVGDFGDRMDKIGRHSTEKGVSLLTLWYVRAKFSKAIDDGRNCPLEICEIDAWLSSFLEKQAARNNVEEVVGDKMVSQVGSSTCVSQMESMHQISIRDHDAPIETKGRPKVATRLKSSIELAKEEKKQRTCAYCHGKGHYRTGCAKRK